MVRRTFREDKIYNLLSLPQGTNALIVNDSDETTLETISLFYKIEWLILDQFHIWMIITIKI